MEREIKKRKNGYYARILVNGEFTNWRRFYADNLPQVKTDVNIWRLRTKQNNLNPPKLIGYN